MQQLTVWTIQPEPVWRALQAESRLYVDQSKLPSDYVPPSYRWLADQLAQRWGAVNRLPWWVYCSLPDLRIFRFRHKSESEQVRLQLLVPAQELVCFPREAWSRVYSGLTLHSDAKLNDPSEEAPNAEEEITPETKESWKNLFLPTLDAYGSESIGVVPSLEIGWVKRAQVFRGASAIRY